MRKTTAALAFGMILAGGGAAAQNSANDWYTVAMAAARNQTEQVRTMLAQGGNDPDAIDSQSGRTALDFAASFDNTEIAKLLLDHGAHIDARDRQGNTALHWAAERGSIAMVRFLIANKAAVDAANRQGITPIMLAADHLQPASVRALIEQGADPRKQDYSGRDAYGWAAGKPAVLKVLDAKR